MLNWFQQFFRILDILLKLFLWTRKVDFWQPGSDFIPIYNFLCSSFGRIRKKERFPLLQIAPLDCSTNLSKMRVILKHFSKNLEPNVMKKFFFKNHACILSKGIINTLAICSFVCWVPCNLFSLDLQLEERYPQYRDGNFPTEVRQVRLGFQPMFVYTPKKLENTEKFNRTCKVQFSQPCWKRFVGACKKFCSTDSNSFFEY